MRRLPRLPTTVALVVLGILCGGVAPVPRAFAGAKDGAVEAACAWESGPLTTPRAMFLPLSETLPKDLDPPPGLAAPRYARIRWGEGRGLAIALDVGAGRQQLWIDRDLDGAFGQPGIESVSWGGSSESLVREVEVSVVYEDEEARIPVRFLRAAAWDADRVRIIPLVHRLGLVELEGRLRKIALVDANADLRFGESKYDAAFLDLDGDGELDLAAEGGERIVPGEPFRLGEHGWLLEIPRVSGAVVRFVPSAKTPPERPRAWPSVGVPAAGYRPPPPTESLARIVRRLEAQEDLPYAQRYATVAQLGAVGTKEAFERLYALVRHDGDAAVRAAAARAMGNAAYLDVGGDRVVELTGDPTPGVAMGAVDALHRMDHPDRERVYLRLLQKAPAAVAGRAATNLAYLGTPSALAAVRKAWKEGSTPQVRYAVYQGLRVGKDGPPRDVVREGAADPYALLAAMALGDLFRFEPAEAVERAKDLATRRPVNIQLGREVIRVLSANGDGESVRLLLALVEDLPAMLESDLAEGLSPLRGSEAIDALVDGLKDDDPAVRRLAAQTLAGVVRPKVAEALIARARRERDKSVLAALLEALGDQGDEDAISLLLKKARTRDDEVRRAAIRALGRVGLHVEKVRTTLLKFLTSREWEDRVLAVDAVAASGDAGLVEKLFGRLADDAWQVRLAAAQAAARLRAGAAIGPLIDRLQAEGLPRVKDAVAGALFRITGMHLYDDPAIWRDWWSKQGPDYRPPDDVPMGAPPTPGGTTAGFYGIPLRSDRVVFVIDQSGSMSALDTKLEGKTRLETALGEVRAAVDHMGDRDRANVILFHTTVHPWHDRLQRLTKKNRGELASYLDDKQPMGGTNLYDALELALLEEDVDTIFLLSDGAPGVGRYVAKDDILRAVRRLNQTRRICIHAIAVGMSAPLMKELAEENGGEYIRR